MTSPWGARAQGLANIVGGILFVALFLVFLVQIAARFVFNLPLPWTDEAAVILYLWVILWAAALMVQEREHVMFDLFWNAADPRTRQAMRVTGHLLIGTLAVIALPASWDYVHFMRREGTPVLGIPLMVVYLPFVLLMAALVVRNGWGLWQALRGRNLQ